MQVEIRDLQALPVDRDLLAEAARLALDVAGGSLDAVAIAIVDDRRIREVNRSYRNSDSPTDVIAFEAEDGPEGRSGEVIISAETAARQAREVGHSLQAELCLLVAHGVLHVLGYEDYDQASRATMEELQQEVLAALQSRLDSDA